MAVLSHDLWTNAFARTDVVGTSVDVSGIPFRVVGVAPVGFGGAELEAAPELWAPFTKIREVASTGLYAAPNIGIAPVDTGSFAGGALLLTAAGVTAALGPVLGAARTDPVRALAAEA